jgi:hypothetical protein
MPQYPFNRYALRVYSSRPTQAVSPNQLIALIYCYEAAGSSIHYRGSIWFFSDCTPLRPATHDAPNNRIHLQCHISQFAATIEILRTEEPLWLFYDSPTNAFLKSGLEPTGEEETP